MQVKMVKPLKDDSHRELEEEINKAIKFLNDRSKSIKDIKYSESVSCTNHSRYSAMIIYE